MFGSLIKKVVGSKNERELKRIRPIIERINELESDISSLSDEQLRGKTAEFKERIQQGGIPGRGLARSFRCRSGSREEDLGRVSL